MEVWGVEPQSESQTARASPSADHVLTFPPPNRHGRRYGISSFINSGPPQSLSGTVPCFCDADCLRRRRLRVDVHGLSRESYVIVVVSSLFVPLLGGTGPPLATQVLRAPVETSTPPCRGLFNPARQRRAQCPGRCRAWPCRRACRRASCPCTARSPSSFSRP